MKDKRGQIVFVYFMIGVLFFVLGMAIAPALTDTSNEVQGNLDCDNASISNQDKSVCYQVDSMAPLFIGVIFGFGGILLARVMGV